MKRIFVFRTPKGGVSNVFFGDELTPEQEKEQALKLIKSEAKAAALEAYKSSISDIFETGLSKKEIKEKIEALVKEVVKSYTFEDGTETEKTVSDITAALQKQHDDLAKIVRELQKGTTVKEGTFIAFVKETIDKNPNGATDKSYSAATVIKAAALMTTANVIPNVTNGFSPLFGNYIDEEIGHVPKPENVIMPLITVKNQPGTERIWYTDRINEEGDAEFIAEGALKPLADAEWKTSTAPIKEVAVRWKFTKRLMAHAPSVVSDFLEHANELVEQKIDDQLLDGDGVGNNLTGMQTIAAAFVVPPALANFYERANIYDVINAMASRIRLSNFKGTITAVLNTVWKAKMLGYKDADGRYLVPDFVSPDGTQVSDVKVVYSNKIDADSILIGELKNFNLVMAEDITYDEGYENDDFSKNLVSKKLEAFLGTYIKASKAGSILFDEISTVLTAIAAPDPVETP